MSHDVSDVEESNVVSDIVVSHEFSDVEHSI